MFPGELREFLAVVRAGSIRKASEMLGVAPSSVSRKLALFEHQFGTALFERTAEGATLTPAGVLVADYARSTLADYDSLRADLNDRRGTKRRVIRLTVVESVVSGGLMKAAATLRAQFNTLSFRVNVVAATQVAELLRKGDADIGITFCQQPHSDFITIAQIPEPIVLAVSPDHPFAGRETVSMDELVDLPLAVPDLTFGVRARFDRAWYETHRRIDPTIASVSNSFESLREFVRYEGGGAILPFRAVVNDQGQSHLKVILIDHPDCRNCTLDIMVLRKNRLPIVIDQFLKTLTQTLQNQTFRRATGLGDSG